jgi:hypothetical protein
MWSRAVRKRLVAHFLRRFLENDLLSPEADRHGVVTTTCAALATIGAFLAVLLSLKYLFRPVQSAGWTAMVALDDIFLYAGCSMVVMGFVAVAAWDALALDTRDAAILGALPVGRARLARAQATAVIVFAGVFGIALNLVPSVISPVLRVSKLPVSLVDLAWLVAAQAIVTTAAGVFGFALVFAVREATRALLPSAWFARVSTLLQASLVVLLATSFLLLPAVYSGVARRWIAPIMPAIATMPPLWFVGLHEAIAGNVLDRLPPTEPPPDAPARMSMVAFEGRMRAEYREQKPALASLARLAVIGLTSALLAAAAAWAWNARRLPVPPVARRTHRGGIARLGMALIERIVVRRPASRAGYFFTLQTLSRSVPHRMAAATTLAGAMALSAVCLRATGVGSDIREVPVTLFALQTLILVVLVAGLRHATGLPADLRASPAYWLSSTSDDRSFVQGVKRALLTCVAVPALAALFALHVFLLGVPAAGAHAISGLLVACMLIDGAFAGESRVPLVSAHVPGGNLLGLAPIYVALTLTVVFGFAWIERAVSTSAGGVSVLWAALTAIWIAVRWWDRAREDGTALRPELDELPAAPTQRLTLSE